MVKMFTMSTGAYVGDFTYGGGYKPGYILYEVGGLQYNKLNGSFCLCIACGLDWIESYRLMFVLRSVYVPQHFELLFSGLFVPAGLVYVEDSLSSRMYLFAKNNTLVSWWQVGGPESALDTPMLPAVDYDSGILLRFLLRHDWIGLDCYACDSF